MVRLFEPLETEQKVLFSLTELEVRSAIRRRLAQQDLSTDDAQDAVKTLSGELGQITVQQLTPALLEAAIAIVDRQNIRALDALQLSAALRVKESLTGLDQLRFIASDAKLLRAATQEGLDTWNPCD